MNQDYINIYGAREHNLKDISLKIPRNQLVVITGLSGSGKSSLAFDTIYAEGQRRYIETFSAYARQFLGTLDRPDVDKIDGLSPVIAIEQKTTSKNPRSTVGTVTELYDFFRLLYARASDAYSYKTGEKMVTYSEDQITDLIYKDFSGEKVLVLAPLIRSRKGHYRELFANLAKKGFLQVRVDGELLDIVPDMKLDRYKIHDIEVVIDKLIIDTKENTQRIIQSIRLAMQYGEGTIMLLKQGEEQGKYFSRNLMCPSTGISYQMPEPNTFSFNSPKGACEHCNGLGRVKEININKLVPNPKLSFDKNVFPIFEELSHTGWILSQIDVILKKNGFTMSTPWEKLSDQAKDEILYGINDKVTLDLDYAQIKKTYKVNFEGIIDYITRLSTGKDEEESQKFKTQVFEDRICPVCEGARLKKESLFFKIDNKNISEIARFSLQKLSEWIHELPSKLSENNQIIAKDLIQEISKRLSFLVDVGLDYLSLDRPSQTLSGGESQRIRLATQIGSQLVNVLYILDEPSIGLHQRDNIKLIDSLKKLRDLGNSVLVVEHDKDMILNADYVIDMGPLAGKGGGEVVWEGKPQNISKANTLTAKYINGELQIPIPEERRKGNGNHLKLTGCTGNNLKNVTLDIPLGSLVCITGVSGSGKSSLITNTLYPILNKHFYRAEKEPLPYKKIEGIEFLDKIVDVDQSPIGRTPRSNPATYTGVFTDIRNLFAQLPESKIRGYQLRRFSFNVKGGRCEVCQGSGLKLIEMNFLPDIYVHCEACHGKRFNRETLEVRYKGKSISDVLDMTIDEAVDFFQPIPKIHRIIKTLQEVGLGYITLGQQSTTLSGGEAQRVKLAKELSKKQTGNTIYILDEPTTGLHFEDIRILMEVINRLVNLGNSIIIIEHNLDVIKAADYIIDIGLEGGDKGGKIIAQGTPEEVVKNKSSYTAKFLKDEL
ncbi:MULTISPECIES: excinuclease ABC subunit UvrA [unclassified Apibacter]|uniref:excinuclease ABC subunit UvrA n=1 Tax=unclassified Apibacter TaxID=2630820 RepID=UPI00132B5772|nr:MULTISPECIES: excinuclease ABC subunit UvrA [unclassified Apibacter]MCX8676634.1 excinuclease ABC subunit UvrA [Apibacter sp. B3919]MXO24092.1 excinuclease ABC subunit UvrA [Apibacter sp. B3924]MXO26227.1 excinuclease ABC subunit UvrA [Apibacter sp. B3813]MXO28178.1 excinuclease ABC subunit UvrA [Apibacter sp. B3913]MXO30132.1 excinuclease ABC subunit UvrA [Apibacter sp. B3912]